MGVWRGEGGRIWGGREGGVERGGRKMVIQVCRKWLRGGMIVRGEGVVRPRQREGIKVRVEEAASRIGAREGAL
jgi:hypothetical protein